jgi:hypothetical protein
MAIAMKIIEGNITDEIVKQIIRTHKTPYVPPKKERKPRTKKEKAVASLAVAGESAPTSADVAPAPMEKKKRKPRAKKEAPAPASEPASAPEPAPEPEKKKVRRSKKVSEPTPEPAPEPAKKKKSPAVKKRKQMKNEVVETQAVVDALPRASEIADTLKAPIKKAVKTVMRDIKLPALRDK